ncbi:hypothetical protein PR048_012248 [Dryococelus australis]|uniref:BESS domain-containing protein n=1 Tax=Dryococelus australis TaxID=614101 RepID=A0ABQ9HP79_9NEOP|nr:hypothetical protein PR048_012248 [Dryococelus australis]
MRTAYCLAEVMQFELPFIKIFSPPSHGNLPEVTKKDDSQAISQDSSETFACYEDDRDNHEHGSPSEARSLLTQTVKSTLPLPHQLLPVKPPTSASSHVEAEHRETDKNYSLPENTCNKNMTTKQKAEVEADRSSEDKMKDSCKIYLLSLIPEMVPFSEAQLKLFKRRVFGLNYFIALMEKSSNASAPTMTSFPQPSLSSMSSLSKSPSLRNEFGVGFFQLSSGYKKPALNISVDVRMSPEHPATSLPFRIVHTI